MQRKYVNAAVGSTGFVSLAGWIVYAVKWILDQVGRAQTASDLYKTIAPIQVNGVVFNWPLLYFAVAVFSAAFLIAINWDWLRAWYRRRTTPRRWDYPAAEAINYIAITANVGKSFTYRTRIPEAAEMFRDFAAHGRFQVAGRTAGSGLLVPVSRKTWNRAKMEYLTAPSSNFGPQGVTDVSLVSRDDKKTVLYRGLMVVGYEVRDIFP